MQTFPLILLKPAKALALGLLTMCACVSFATAASDDRASAGVVTMPFVEVVDNSLFTADATLASTCDLEVFKGDFFYRYTPAEDLTLNIKAVGDDARVVVATSDLSDCLIDSDGDLIVSTNWWTINYPELLDDSSCEGDCNENVDVDLTGGVEYLIAIAAFDNRALGHYCVSMAEGSDAAIVGSSPNCLPVPLDDDERTSATAITMPFVQVVDNSSFSTDSTLASTCGLEDFKGDFFYRYTPAEDLTLNIKAVGDDARVVVATSDLSDCLIDSDDDLIESPNWWTINYPELLEDSSCEGGCNENVDVDLTGGVEYLLAIAAYNIQALGYYCVSMAEGSDAAIVESSPNCLPVPPVPVPVLPIQGLLLLGGLLGLFSLRKLKQ